MTLTRTVNAALLSPALVWSAIGLRDLMQNGFHSYTSLFPIPFKTHTLSLLNMTAFYTVTFLIITPRRPVRNFSIATSLIFLFNALYEFVYAIFYDVTALVVALPLLTGGIVLILVLNRKLHFLTRHKSKIFLAVLLFFCFLAVMITLNQTGFFAQVHLYLSGQTANDPHSPLWFLSKVLCLWMLFPLEARRKFMTVDTSMSTTFFSASGLTRLCVELIPSLGQAYCGLSGQGRWQET